MKRCAKLIGIGCLSLMPVAALAATSLVAKSPSSATATELSTNSMVSDDGRFVVFLSSSPNIVEGDDNLTTDAFLFDRNAGVTERLEGLRVCSSAGDWFDVDDVSVSANGRYTAIGITELCDLEDEYSFSSLVVFDRQTGARRVIESGYDKQYVHARFSADGVMLVFQFNDWNSCGSAIRLFDQVSGQVTPVSQSVDDSCSNYDSFDPTISADGMVIAFSSREPILVADDTNNKEDVFVYRRATGLFERVSRSTAGAQGNGPSVKPVISADGKYVAYSSTATNLVSGDTNAASDVFMYDLSVGTVARVSKKSAGGQLNGASFHPAISADGRYVFFSSIATDVVADDTNDAEDIFVRDRIAVTTTRVSVTATAEQGNGASAEPTVSSDGRYLAFRSAASNFVANDKNRATDVLWLDRQTATFVAATKAAIPSAGIGVNYAIISPNGAQIAFTSSSASFVANDFNDTQDVFVRDLATNIVARVSKANDGSEANGYSSVYAISDSGRVIVFSSYATNLVANDTTFQKDLFVRDRDAQTTKQVNVSTAEVEGNAAVYDGVISRNGRFVLFLSQATNLVDAAVDPYHADDLFMRDLVAGTTERINQKADGQKVYLANSTVRVNMDGRYVAFTTDEQMVVQDIHQYDYDIYLKDRQTGAFERITPRLTTVEEWCCFKMQLGGISADNRYVVFTSESPSLVANDANDFEDVFLRDRQTGTTTLVDVLPANVAQLDRTFYSSAVSDDGRKVCVTARPFDRLTEVYCKDLSSGAITRASVNDAGVAANADVFGTSMSADGKRVVFNSEATNLVVDPIQTYTAFLHETSSSIVVAPTTLAFGSIKVGKTSAAKLVTVTNSGTVAVKIKSVTLTGATPSQFKKTNSCLSPIVPGAQCTVSVKFKPSSKGIKTATLNVTPESGTAKTVTLNGTGT